MTKVEKQESVVQVVTVCEARDQLGKIARAAYDTGQVTILTRYGLDLAVVMPLSWLEQAA